MTKNLKDVTCILTLIIIIKLWFSYQASRAVIKIEWLVHVILLLVQMMTFQQSLFKCKPKGFILCSCYSEFIKKAVMSRFSLLELISSQLRFLSLCSIFFFTQFLLCRNLCITKSQQRSQIFIIRQLLNSFYR